MILVTGATGRTGRNVVRELTGREVALRAFVDDLDEARQVLPEGTDAVEGDYERPATVAAAMTGVDQVFLVAPGSPRLVAQEANVIDAAVAHGVRRIVKVSGLGAATDSAFSITRWHAESEHRLRGCGLNFTILRPNFFMQNFLFMFAPRIVREGAIYAPVGDGGISMVDCRDVAAVAAAVLTAPGHDGATYAVTGPQALTMTEAGRVVSTVTGRPIHHVDLSPEQALRDMVEHGVREPFAEALLGLFAFFREGRGAVVTDVVAEVAGTPPRTFERFVGEHAAELGGSR
jgi:uncharacterized protein YbjT (DUF2867 family)